MDFISLPLGFGGHVSIIHGRGFYFNFQDFLTQKGVIGLDFRDTHLYEKRRIKRGKFIMDSGVHEILQCTIMIIETCYKF